MSTIKSISEAFSMQPVTIEVKTKEYYDNTKNPNHAKLLCKEIRLMTIHRGPDPIMMYVGYNFNGNQLFEYLANSVNVHYEPIS